MPTIDDVMDCLEGYLPERVVLVGVDVGTENEKLFEFAGLAEGEVNGQAVAVLCAGERVGI